MRRIALAILTCFAALTLAAYGTSREGSVVVIPITGTIDDGMAHLVARAVDDARARHAAAIVVDINTPGGLVSSATEMRDALLEAGIPTIAFIAPRAWSAGSLVALSTRTIEMMPGSSIGAAEPIPKTVKTVSALRAEFEATAERTRRDPRIAAAMVDATIDLPPYKKAGAILTLTADEAVRAKIADGIANSLPDALRKAGIDSRAQLITARYSFGEQLARFATDPRVSGFLLSLGFLGLLIELQTLHGIAGLIGVAALGLFFGTHVYAGFSNEFVVLLAALGVLGILFELHVLPGHGIAGTLGVLALLSAALLAFGVPFLAVGVQALATALVVTIVAFWIVTRIVPHNAFYRRLAFTGAQGPDFVSSADHRGLLGACGVATSFLRPSGVAEIAGQRVTVLTEGDFVPVGTSVRVTRVEGSRIFVCPQEKT